MLKSPLSLLLIFASAVNSVPVESIKEIKLECDEPNPNTHPESFNCYFLDVVNSSEQLNVTSMNYDIKSDYDSVLVMIYGNENYPERFPKNLNNFLITTSMFTYSRTPLKYLKRSEFEDMAFYLGYLNLEHNEIEEIPHDLFYDMLQVSNINLGHNNIKSLPANLFEKTESLQMLDIESNKIKELHPDLFKNCPDLTSLDADFNEVEEIHKDLFKHNPEMHSIRFTKNKIRKIGIDFEKFEELNSAVFLHNQGTCDIMYLNYKPSDNYYTKEEIQVWYKTIPEFQQKVGEVCKG